MAYFLAPIKKRWYVLLAASLLFYFYNAKILSAFILITSLTVYFSAIWIEKINTCAEVAKSHLPKEEKAAFKNGILWQKKAVVVILILINFGILVALKYSGFVVHNLSALFFLLHMHIRFRHIPMLLPLGISFYTLQAVSYVIDVYRGKIKANRNYGQVLLFCIFFPQIVEGPIGRYEDLAPQLYKGHQFDYKNFTFGLQLILWGLLKEIVIADRASMLVDQVFDHFGKYSGFAVMLATLLYTLQLYADFSGSMDVVTGSAQILGIHLTPNFRRPFFSRSVNEFWRRWHISLGAWLRDYVFYPVSLSKPLSQFSRFIRHKHNTHLGKWVTAGSALFFVWLGMGIWHGAGWKYFVYGMYYYMLMMLGMLFEPVTRKVIALLHLNPGTIPYRIFQIVRTFVLVNIGMMIFRAGSLKAAVYMFLSIFHGSGISAITNGSLLKLGLDSKDLTVLAISAAVLLIVGLLQEKGISIRHKVGGWPLPVRWIVYFTAIFALIIFGAYGAGYIPANMIYAGF
ncbi:MAG TPA: MBOAT family O-acyltransferase [Ruminiclostridium sp.]|nr:MBOAT family O-acyltransferase [Ruminiclostridium sp.]